jgi:type IV fimbrial biogenesis protein FimT
MNKRVGKRPRVAGFTLLEALVVMAVLGLMVSLAAPAISALRQQHRLQAQAEDFFNSLVMARSEALRRQQRVTLCARASDNACDVSGTWPQGWLVFVDANGNARLEAGDALLEVHAPVPTDLRMTVTSTAKAYFSYNAEGRSATPSGAFMAGTWRFCRPGSALGWQVVSNALGRPRLEKVQATDCG